MRKSTMLLCLALVGLSSCAHRPTGVGGLQPPNPKIVPVNVLVDQIEVEEVTHLTRGNTEVSWVLDKSAASGYMFGADAVKFEVPAGLPKDSGCGQFGNPPDEYRICTPRDNGSRFTCERWFNPKKAACLKYTLTLQPRTKGGKPLRRPLDPKDPWIANE